MQKKVDYLQLQIEALIFASPEPITLEDIRQVFEPEEEDETQNVIAPEMIENCVEKLIQKYQSNDYAFEIVPLAGGYQMLTKGAYHDVIGKYLKNNTRKQLSKSALETLSIIAYKQPVPKSELELIRGVNCDYAIQKLLEKELIDVKGRSEAPGRPLLYGTSQKFMDYFGIHSLKDLPKLKEILPEQNSIGEPAPIQRVVKDEESKNG